MIHYPSADRINKEIDGLDQRHSDDMRTVLVMAARHNAELAEFHSKKK